MAFVVVWVAVRKNCDGGDGPAGEVGYFVWSGSRITHNEGRPP